MQNERRITIVMITHNRREEVLRSLAMFHRDQAAPPMIVVDNASVDGTFEAIKSQFPQVRLVRLESNVGTIARNIGVAIARTPYVALADDDTYWEPGCVSRAADHFDRCPRLAIVVGRLLNGEQNQVDSICDEMEQSPLPRQPEMPGPSLIGFLAGASAVRRHVFLALGGFPSWTFLGGEEELLALDLAMTGRWICYVSDIVIHHFPSVIRDSRLRKIHLIRNRLFSCWLRRSLKAAVATTAEALIQSLVDREARLALGQFAMGLPKMLRHRRPVSMQIERQLELLDHQKRQLSRQPNLACSMKPSVQPFASEPGNPEATWAP